MTSNEQRREEAQRKLEQQLEQRAKQDRARRRLRVLGAAAGVVLLAGGAFGLYHLATGGDGEPNGADAVDASDLFDDTEPEVVPMPGGRATALPATVDCVYAPGGEPAKPNEPPNTVEVAAEGTVPVVLQTSAGPVGLTLDRAKSPCTVNSVESLATQGYFDDTPCHRVTTDGIYVLQCGDPTGVGNGGPGYVYGNEFPTDQFAADDPLAFNPMNYARGVVAMANAGPDTNGSQFFLVYQDSPLPPQYTVFGTIDEDGLATLDTVAAAGAEGGEPDGPPATPVVIESVTL